MASSPGDDDDDFGGDFPGTHNARRGSKRSFGDLDDEEEDIFSSKKKGHGMAEESAPGVATGMILSLRESLQNCKDKLGTCQSQLEKAKKKEAAFIVTFAKREQEIAELKSAVRDLKAQMRPPSMQARRLLLDPAIHEEFTRLKNLVEEKEKKVKELQDNVAAVNFTPQSKMGKMLMAKCRTLQEENEEIGMMASEGKIHELGMKLALQKSQNAELRRQFQGLHDYMEELTETVEKSNEMVKSLRRRLEEKDKELQRLKAESASKESSKEGKDQVGDQKADQEIEVEDGGKDLMDLKQSV